MLGFPLCVKSPGSASNSIILMGLLNDTPPPKKKSAGSSKKTPSTGRSLGSTSVESATILELRKRIEALETEADARKALAALKARDTTPEPNKPDDRKKEKSKPCDFWE